MEFTLINTRIVYRNRSHSRIPFAFSMQGARLRGEFVRTRRIGSLAPPRRRCVRAAAEQALAS
jgi:hypothetical protein